MFEVKKISPEATEAALEKAERYRLLNEPWEAESICLDVLETEPDHQRALVVYVLSLSDQLLRADGSPHAERRAKEALQRVQDEYTRTYYHAVVVERRAKAQLRQHRLPGHIIYESLREAMDLYEKAEPLRPAGNEDCRLRYNACARLLMLHPHARAAVGWASEGGLE